MLSIGIIISPFQSEEVHKRELVPISSKRPWLFNLPEEYTLFDVQYFYNEDDSEETEQTLYTTDDISICFYLKCKYSHLARIDIIPANELTMARLKANHVNFLVIYDILEAFHTLPSAKYQNFKSILETATNIFPTPEIQKLINFKHHYYHYLQKHNIPVLDYYVIHNQNKTSYHDDIKKFLQFREEYEWNHFVAKPLYGQESNGFKAFYEESDFELLEKYVEDKFNMKYPGIIFQNFIRSFATARNKEVRCFFIDGVYKYTIYTWNKNQSIEVAHVDGQSIPVELQEYIFLAHKTFEVLPKVTYFGVAFNPILLRVDMCHTEDGDLFVSEIEFVPSLFLHDLEKTNIQTDVLIADKMIEYAQRFVVEALPKKYKSENMKYMVLFICIFIVICALIMCTRKFKKLK